MEILIKRPWHNTVKTDTSKLCMYIYVMSFCKVHTIFAYYRSNWHPFAAYAHQKSPKRRQKVHSGHVDSVLWKMMWRWINVEHVNLGDIHMAPLLLLLHLFLKLEVKLYCSYYFLLFLFPALFVVISKPVIRVSFTISICGCIIYTVSRILYIS